MMRRRRPILALRSKIVFRAWVAVVAHAPSRDCICTATVLSTVAERGASHGMPRHGNTSGEITQKRRKWRSCRATAHCLGRRGRAASRFARDGVFLPGRVQASTMDDDLLPPPQPVILSDRDGIVTTYFRCDTWSIVVQVII